MTLYVHVFPIIQSTDNLYYMEYILPERYNHLISQAEYETIMKMSIACLKKEMEITEISEDGTISVKKDEVVIHCALDNLVRWCAQEEDREQWFEIVANHFEKVLTIELKPDLSNFELIREMLAVRVYPRNYFELLEDGPNKLIYKEDFEDMISVLVLDLPDKFQSLTRDMIESWEATTEELFAIAQNNVNEQEIDVKQFVLSEKFEFFAFLSGDYSASYILDFDNNADFARGVYGSIVALPTKGAVFVHPIQGLSVMECVQELLPIVLKFYHEDPGNLTTNLYWRYKGEFYVFDKKEETDGYILLHMPEELFNLLNGSN